MSKVTLAIAAPAEFSMQDFETKTINQKLDYISWFSPQYPNSAKALIETLESSHQHHPLSDTLYLKLQLVSCFNAIDMGQNENAVDIAKKGADSTKIMRIDQAKPYFLACEASAYDFLGKYTLSNLINEEAIKLAKQYDQPQALLLGLVTRSLRENINSNYLQASENIKIAKELYPVAKQQLPSWYMVPAPYLKMVMSNLLYSSGDAATALDYAKEILKDPQTNGAIAIGTAFYLARISISLGDLAAAEKYLSQSKHIIPEAGNKHNQAIFNAQTAYIELHLGNLSAAEEAINKSLLHFVDTADDLKVMRAKRTLSLIYFAQHKTAEALSLMTDIVKQADDSEQYFDLIEFHQILSDYYEQQNQFEQALKQQQLKFNASQKANEQLSNSRIAQIKASREPIENPSSQRNAELLMFQAQNVALLSLGIFILLASFVAFIYRKPQSNKVSEHLNDPLQLVDTILTQAKQSHYPLTLLLLDTDEIRQVDISIVQEEVQQTLREQDKILRVEDNKMAILLPFASEEGALKVIRQLTPIIQPYLSVKLHFGSASLQQLDNLQTLVKRAELNKLAKLQKQHQGIK
ncbi:hypothetical protein GCM10009193_24860 [Shewanella aestuarii]|nr:hypothetical protein GCM10009193_24860 [Shewanella aestuarii]